MPRLSYKESFDYLSIQHILETFSYREFINRIIEVRSKSLNRKYGYSDIAHNAGFASRSYPRDVVLGKKRITLQSIHKFTRGLRLSGDLARYFQLLIEFEHDDCRTSNVEKSKIKEKLHSLKARLYDKYLPTDKKVEVNISSENFFIVYAALGSLDQGSTINEIVKRTGLSSSTIQTALDELEKYQYVNHLKNVYKATRSHLTFSDLKESSGFKALWLNFHEKAKIAALKKFDSDDMLFYSSCFSIDTEDLPELKREMRAMLMSFVDKAEKAPGNKIAFISASLFYS